MTLSSPLPELEAVLLMLLMAYIGSQVMMCVNSGLCPVQVKGEVVRLGLMGTEVSGSKRFYSLCAIALEP